MAYSYKVSVLITTYNHEKYIEEAIESVLAQKMIDPIEIIISDDFSTDRTRQIVESYQCRFPLKIKVLESSKNLGITKNLQKGLAACQGKYIAILEGDDYWISLYKLQRQINFLDNRLDCSFCFNALFILNPDNIYIESPNGLSPNTSSIPIETLVKSNVIGTFSSCMFRNDIVQKLPNDLYEMFTVDWMFGMACAQFGFIGFIPLQMTVYRIQGQGAWSALSSRESLEKLNKLIPLYDQFLDYKFSSIFSYHLQNNRLQLQTLDRPYYLQFVIKVLKILLPTRVGSLLKKIYLQISTRNSLRCSRKHGQMIK